MKKFAVITVIASLVLMMACGGGSNQSATATPEDVSGSTSEQQAVDEVSNKKLPFEHGAYVEVSKVMGMEMTKTIYFDKWGEWTATEFKMEIMPGYGTHTLDIIKGKTHWNIDFTSKTGEQYDDVEFSADMDAVLGADMTNGMTNGMTMEEMGTEEHLGYKCKKVNVKHQALGMDITTLSYGNMTMKVIGKSNGVEMVTEVVSIDLSAPPASIFEVPAGITIQKKN